MVQYYSLADVYLNLSREETFGKVIAEALACGTPAIVFNSTACPEIVRNDSGDVVPTNNLEAVYDAVLKIKKLGKERFSDKCIQRAEMYFNPDYNIQETINLYYQIMDHVP